MGPAHPRVRLCLVCTVQLCCHSPDLVLCAAVGQAHARLGSLRGILPAPLGADHPHQPAMSKSTPGASMLSYAMPHPLSGPESGDIRGWLGRLGSTGIRKLACPGAKPGQFGRWPRPTQQLRGEDQLGRSRTSKAGSAGSAPPFSHFIFGPPHNVPNIFFSDHIITRNIA